MKKLSSKSQAIGRNRSNGFHLDALERRTLFSGPAAALTPPAPVMSAVATVDLTVTYTDNVGVNPATLGAGDPNDPAYPNSPQDLTVTGPNGFTTTAVFLSPDTLPGVQPSLAGTYRFAAPHGRFTSADNGTYTVSVRANSVFDGDGNAVPAGSLGTFTVSVPASTGGNPDAGFDTDFTVQATAVQADGKLLAAGSESYARFGQDALGEDPNQVYTFRREVLRRFNADGSVDTTFGGGTGRVVSPDGTDATAYAVAARPDGSIYVAGGGGFPTTTFILTRYTSAGAVDTNFGNNGTASIGFNVFGNGSDVINVAQAIAFQSTGKIVLGGYATLMKDANTEDTDFALCRLNPNGSLDTSFGTNGLVTTDLSGGGYDSVGGLVVTPTDQIVAAGAAGTKVGVARYGANGGLDGTFGAGGKETLTSLGVPVVDAGAGGG